MNERIEALKNEVCKAVIGKEEIVTKVLTAILAGGHILLEDIPGVGKTTLALAFSKAMGFKFNRVQFTPDVVPSDITGFTMYDKKDGEFKYVSGTAMCNFLLADEINRTSSKTQSALLEVMQEGNVTVDGISHEVPKPFVVMATQNPLGTAGTQMLPEAQLDRFMIQLSMGYPDAEAQVAILRDRDKADPLDDIKPVAAIDEVVKMKEETKDVYVDDKIYCYVTELAEATRNHPYIKLGVSPRGAIALCSMAKAGAYIKGRDYVVPKDIEEIFADVCRHRIILESRAKLADETKDSVIAEILSKLTAPTVSGNEK